MNKICTNCRCVKGVLEFSIDRSRTDNRHHTCKVCRKEKREGTKSQKAKTDAAYYKRNREEILAYHKVWRTINKDSVSKKRVLYQKTRRSTDAIFRMQDSLRTLLRRAIVRGYGIKAFKTLELLGASWEVVKVHLETQFKDGMNWDNHGRGGWHFDHIRPIASFDMSCPEQQKLAHHYTNLQPLWEADNIRKGAKW